MIVVDFQEDNDDNEVGKLITSPPAPSDVSLYLSRSDNSSIISVENGEAADSYSKNNDSNNIHLAAVTENGDEDSDNNAAGGFGMRLSSIELNNVRSNISINNNLAPSVVSALHSHS